MSIFNVKSCNILTVHLTDQLATHEKISFTNCGGSSCNLPIKLKVHADANDSKREFRIFNEANNSKFETFINSENWE